jgi:fermentation-respiration switch protein FrsA (DUF1100 family)
MGASEIDVHQLPIKVEGDTATAVLEVPRSAAGLVVLGHGLSASRESSYLRLIAGQLHELSLATVSMDAPLHGSRRQGAESASFQDWVTAWQGFWRAGGSARMVAEYHAILDACPAALRALPIGYWGISLATQAGIPWLAQDPRPRAAVLGQFRGDGLLMERFAPQVGVPVFFIQQQADELHSVEVSQRLFDLIGSEHKQMRSSPGAHTEVPRQVLDESVTWLAEQLSRLGT